MGEKKQRGDKKKGNFKYMLIVFLLGALCGKSLQAPSVTSVKRKVKKKEIPDPKVEDPKVEDPEDDDLGEDGDGEEEESEEKEYGLSWTNKDLSRALYEDPDRTCILFSANTERNMEKSEGQIIVTIGQSRIKDARRNVGCSFSYSGEEEAMRAIAEAKEWRDNAKQILLWGTEEDCSRFLRLSSGRNMERRKTLFHHQPTKRILSRSMPPSLFSEEITEVIEKEVPDLTFPPGVYPFIGSGINRIAKATVNVYHGHFSNNVSCTFHSYGPESDRAAIQEAQRWRKNVQALMKKTPIPDRLDITSRIMAIEPKKRYLTFKMKEFKDLLQGDPPPMKVAAPALRGDTLHTQSVESRLNIVTLAPDSSAEKDGVIRVTQQKNEIPELDEESDTLLFRNGDEYEFKTMRHNRFVNVSFSGGILGHEWARSLAVEFRDKFIGAYNALPTLEAQETFFFDVHRCGNDAQQILALMVSEEEVLTPIPM